MSKSFLLLITERTFLTRRFTWRVFALYMMNPTFEVSGHVWSFAFYTWALGWNTCIASWMCLLSELLSSGVPLNMSIMCMLRVLAWGVPSNSHLLNISRLSRACPLFHDRPRASLMESFDLREFYWKDMVLTPPTLLWCGIHAGVHALPSPFFLLCLPLWR